jgi:hypothetical protein
MKQASLHCSTVQGGGKRRRPKLTVSCLVERSAKLFGKGARRPQIGKAPTVIALPVSEYGSSKSRFHAARLVKTNNLTVQFDAQSI